MGYKDITAGEKTAKALGARLIKSPGKGTPGIEVSFQFLEPSTNGVEKLSWVGWLSPKAKEYTMDTLVNILDSNGDDNINAEGVFPPGFVDANKQVQIVIELQEGKDEHGNVKVDDQGNPKIYPKIAYVNNPGGSMYTGCAPDVGRKILAETGFKASFMAMKQKSGKSTTSAPSQQQQPPNMAPGANSNPPQFNTNERLPF
jgi:hypothetical protein